jgi:hypothetical protein
MGRKTPTRMVSVFCANTGAEKTNTKRQMKDKARAYLFMWWPPYGLGLTKSRKAENVSHNNCAMSIKCSISRHFTPK